MQTLGGTPARRGPLLGLLFIYHADVSSWGWQGPCSVVRGSGRFQRRMTGEMGPVVEEKLLAQVHLPDQVFNLFRPQFPHL